MDQEADSITQWLRKHTEKQGDCLVFTGYKMPKVERNGSSVIHLMYERKL